ncbi:MAG: ferrous iron transport protein B [Bacteroidetes bacterium HGW-Bacteroidetes-16]|jgi:ferrous iron transport protein B|nr:MAG: ferrous iron transport protein B [Bacteroidetes bacterium HGW-Bacteroidetes-16]
MNLADLKNGDRAIILKVKGRGAFRKRIMEMGFIAGKQVIVIKNAPLRDPVEYNVMGYNISLRRSEASLIEVLHGTENGSPGKDFNGVFELEQALRLTPLDAKRKVITVALVGNPNCGKTSLFNYASHSHEKVGNYGGITVDAKEARFEYGGYTFKLTDLPGTYSITSYTPEEIYVREHLVNDLPDVILNVIDTSNIERNLYLTTQLIDMDLKVVIALNMWDEFESKGDAFNYQALGQMMGIPMVPTVGTKGTGFELLFDKIIAAYNDQEPVIRHVHINYGYQIEQSIRRLQKHINHIGNEELTNKVSPRYLAIKLLEQDDSELKRIETCLNAREIKDAATEEAKIISDLRKDTVETVITDAKYGFIEGALKETLKPAPLKDNITRSRLIDNIVTSPLLSYPIFLFAIWLTFQSTFWLGDYPMQGVQWLISRTGDLVSAILPDGMLKDLLIDGILGGVGGVIIFLPNILILFFFLTLMEASGYMARVAFIVDKLMHRIGLHGKSFVPMLMGFGCNVPAIMATRTIENKNDRLVTMLIIPFMSCSARYPVYILLISAFFSEMRGTILFGIYLFGIMLAGFVAWIMKKTLFKVQTIPFVMELPPYRVPALKSLLKQTWFKGEQYLRKMGTIILVASLIIWVLGYFPKGSSIETNYKNQIQELNSTFQNKTSSPEFKKQADNLKMENMRLKQENSFIGRIGKWIEPAIEPLGFDWKMGVALVAGSAAKEVVVSTLGVLYQSADGDSQGLVQRMKDQKYESGEHKGSPVFTPLVAISFMLFILIYFPCIAVVAAIKNESGNWKWALFLTVYTTILAYLISLMVFQAGSYLGF